MRFTLKKINPRNEENAIEKGEGGKSSKREMNVDGGGGGGDEGGYGG